MTELTGLDDSKLACVPELTGLDLWNACKSGQAHVLREQVEQNRLSCFDPGWSPPTRLVTTDDKNRTLLHIASRFGSYDCVRVLLEAGAHVDAKEWYGATPLFFACQAGQLECAQLLIEHGAVVHGVFIDMKGERNEGVDPLELFTDGATCLLVACRTAQPKLVQLLLRSGSRIYEELRDGQGPLHLLCNSTHGLHRQSPLGGAEECVHILLIVASACVEAPVDVADNYGNTPLHIACNNTMRPDLVNCLLKAGASAHTVNQEGETPLHNALVTLCDEGEQIVRLLIDAGANVLFKDAGGRTALEAATSLRDQADSKRGEAMISLLREPTAIAKAALAGSRRAEKMLEATKRREQEAKQAAAATADQERQARESAPELAAQKARRAAEAAALEETRRDIASETAAKLAAVRATAEASLVLVREKAALAEAVERTESQKALAARKAAAAEQAQRAEEAKRAKGAEEEAKRSAKLKNKADAKKAAKQETKERKSAPSAFKLQEEHEERAREEQRAEEQRARELAAAQEQQQDTLRAAGRRAAELREAELTAAGREAAELRKVMSSSIGEMTEAASPALAQSDPARRSQNSLVGEATLREVMRGVSISEAPPPSAPVESHLASGVRQGTETAAASAQQVLTLADVGDLTCRNDAPESTIGGETTCIVCMARPKTHLAVPCAHQCACGPCAEQMQLCPYCRAPVQLWLEPRMV